jgi:3-hydroxybutyryl-CoA dehydrogenase
MGRGIATACAAAGLDVLLVDRTVDITTQAVAAITETLDRDVAKWRHTLAEKRAILGRLRAVGGHSALEAADLVIEAVPDDLALKVRIFAELDRLAPPGSILATNTSTLSVTEIASHTKRPERVIGLHFLNPGTRAPLVEIVRGLKTSGAALAEAREFVQLLGKTGVEVFESPGYVTTRVLVPFLNEAMYVVMEGVASAEAVDTAMKLGYGLPVGPLALADQVGLDELARWMQHLFRELGDLKYRPCPLLRKMIRAGYLGVKSGRGFFEYEGKGEIWMRAPA